MLKLTFISLRLADPSWGILVNNFTFPPVIMFSIQPAVKITPLITLETRTFKSKN